MKASAYLANKETQPNACQSFCMLWFADIVFCCVSRVLNRGHVGDRMGRPNILSLFLMLKIQHTKRQKCWCTQMPWECTVLLLLHFINLQHGGEHSDPALTADLPLRSFQIVSEMSFFKPASQRDGRLWLSDAKTAAHIRR